MSLKKFSSLAKSMFNLKKNCAYTHGALYRKIRNSAKANKL